MKQERKYKGAKVRLANRQKGIILIPGLDACLVQLEKSNKKIWAITEWEYKRRSQYIFTQLQKKESRKSPPAKKQQKININSNLNVYSQKFSHTDIYLKESFHTNKELKEYIKIFEHLKLTRIISYE